MPGKMFVHVALTINDASEVDDFYSDILGFEETRRFVLNKELTGKLFGIEEDTEIIALKKDDLALEIFVSDRKNSINFEHTCIRIDNREEVIKKVKEKGYPCVIVKRDDMDLVFIKDGSNNLFEVQQTL